MASLTIGVTVAPRHNNAGDVNYVRESLSSLRSAGFAQTVHAFCEPQAVTALPETDTNVNVHAHDVAKGCFPNFRHSLNWLIDNTESDWILLMQDDCVWHPAAYDVLHRGFEQLPEAGFISPYTSRAMVEGGHPGHNDLSIELPAGWVPHRFHQKAFWGAVCLAFPRKSAEDLVSFRRFVTHDHHRKVDVVVGNCTRDMQKTGYVHVPSICDHIGQHSTIGRDRIKGISWGRCGLRFNPEKPLE